MHGLSSSGSYSSIIKARAREAREASKSPPPLGPGEEMEDQGVYCMYNYTVKLEIFKGFTV